MAVEVLAVEVLGTLWWGCLLLAAGVCSASSELGFGPAERQASQRESLQKPEALLGGSPR